MLYPVLRNVSEFELKGRARRRSFPLWSAQKIPSPAKLYNKTGKREEKRKGHKRRY